MSYFLDFSVKLFSQEEEMYVNIKACKGTSKFLDYQIFSNGYYKSKVDVASENLEKLHYTN